ncbi:unnamed protein product, partial [marine sediment metagenome]
EHSPAKIENLIFFNCISDRYLGLGKVARKKHDEVRGKLSDIPYACLSIIYASPQTNVSQLRLAGKGMSLELPTVREPKQLILELDQADVNQMIKTLTDLRDNLEDLRKRK